MPGDIVHGDLAITAIEGGYAVANGEKAKKPPQNKMKKPLLNKSGSALRPGRASRKKTAKP